MITNLMCDNQQIFIEFKYLFCKVDTNINLKQFKHLKNRKINIRR